MLKLILTFIAILFYATIHSQDLRMLENLDLKEYKIVAEKELKKRYLLSKNLPDTLKSFVDTLNLIVFHFEMEELNFYSIPHFELKKNVGNFNKESNFIDFINIENNPRHQTVSIYNNDSLVSGFTISEPDLNDELNIPFVYLINLLFIHKDVPLFCNANCDDLYSYKEGFERLYFTFEVANIPGTLLLKDNKVFFVKMVDEYKKKDTIPFAERLKYLRPEFIHINDYIINYLGIDMLNAMLNNRE